MRYDYFIIWGNGLQYIEDIVDIIRSDNNFTIVTVRWYNIKDDMYNFIRKIYETDDHPWEHLENKTRYLLESEPKLLFILCKNIKPQEKMSIGGQQGKYKHIECKNVTDIKLSIRSKYNPNVGIYYGPPLPNGISHNHVVHASDHEKQVEHILKVLDFPPLSYYRRNDNHEYFIPFHIENDIFNEEIIDIKKIMVDIIEKGIVSVSSTPYYRYLCDDKDEYIRYAKDNVGIICKEDHFIGNFEKIFKSFDINYVNQEGKKCLPIVKKVDDYYRVLDGGHRLAIMLHKEIYEVKCLVC